MIQSTFVPDELDWKSRAALTADAILAEYFSAREKHTEQLRSRHEAYAVLLEEVHEVWDVVRHDGATTDYHTELLQVAAMALAALLETR